MSQLSAESISIAFGGVRALQNVTIRLEAGRIYGLIGPNGAGKTSLFNVLTGVVTPDSGQVLLGGEDVTRWPVHRRARAGMGRTFQNLAVFTSMSVSQNVRAGLLGTGSQGWLSAMLGLAEPGADAEQAVERTLARMRLTDEANTPVAALPLATRKRVELARALVSNPKLLLLDEPAAGLASDEIEVLCALVRSLRDTGTTVLVVEHHMAMVMKLCERIFVLDFGTLIAQGSPREVREHPEVLRAYLGAEVVDALA